MDKRIEAFRSLMDKKIEAFARDSIKHNLALMPEENQHFFRRMYSPDNLKEDINNVVDAIPVELLSWAIQQIENTLRELELKHTSITGAEIK